MFTLYIAGLILSYLILCFVEKKTSWFSIVNNFDEGDVIFNIVFCSLFWPVTIIAFIIIFICGLIAKITRKLIK